jgi:hypothetical protein
LVAAARIQTYMKRASHLAGEKLKMTIALAACFVVVLLSGPRAAAQESPQAPLPAPTDEHDVRRMSNVPEAAAPPALPPEEIIKKFSQKEDEYLSTRPAYSYRKTVRIDEFDHDGKLMGQFMMVTDTIRASNGQVINKMVQHPQSTLHFFTLEPEDVKELDRMPAFPLTTNQLAKYDLKFIGDERIDEIDCYIFQVKPKNIERATAYFDGIVWVDAKYLEVVKTYGKWVNELGPVHIANLPFTTFETYRENVDGKYWFPNYQRSDDTMHLKEGDFPMRLVIKWADFKPLPAKVSDTTPAPAASPSEQSAAPASAAPEPALAPPKPQP